MLPEPLNCTKALFLQVCGALLEGWNRDVLSEAFPLISCFGECHLTNQSEISQFDWDLVTWKALAYNSNRVLPYYHWNSHPGRDHQHWNVHHRIKITPNNSALIWSDPSLQGDKWTTEPLLVMLLHSFIHVIYHSSVYRVCSATHSTRLVMLL